MDVAKALLVLLIACVPIAAILYALMIARTRQLAPDLLERIDPHGFRAMNAGSQLRLGGFLLRRGYREIADPPLRRLYAGFHGLFWVFCLGWLLLSVLLTR
jgi:hypothetical protein